jgi:hypothetical protein
VSRLEKMLAFMRDSGWCVASVQERQLFGVSLKTWKFALFILDQKTRTVQAEAMTDEIAVRRCLEEAHPHMEGVNWL